MNNTKFINEIISKTKADELDWKIASPSTVKKIFWTEADCFYVTINKKNILIGKYFVQEFSMDNEEYSVAHYVLHICSDAFKSEFEIPEEELDSRTLLSRLYRLAERKAKDIDNLLDGLIKSINNNEHP